MFITIVRTAPSLSQSKSAIERGSSVHKKNAKSQRETQRSTETHMSQSLTQSTEHWAGWWSFVD